MSFDYAKVNVNRHSMVKGTLVFTTKAVKSPSAALSLLNKAVPAPLNPVQPKLCKPVCKYKNNPISETVIAVNVPAFHVAVQDTRYVPAEGDEVAPAWLSGPVPTGVVKPVTDPVVTLPPVPSLM
jgi:hypothetical protein